MNDTQSPEAPEAADPPDTQTRPGMFSASRVHAMLRTLPVADLQSRIGEGGILVLAPHPDDESLGCGGLIAQACETGRPVHVLVLTDGSMSHPHSAAYPAARLKRLREAESRDAGAALGLAASHISFLELPDSRAPHRGDAARRAAEAIAKIAGQCSAQTLFTTWRHDPHADHLAASLLARQAARLARTALFEYPIWGWTLPPRRLLRTRVPAGFRLDVGAQLAAKRRAIACHRSQLGQVITDDPSGFTMEQKFVELFTQRYETFIDVAAEDIARARS